MTVASSTVLNNTHDQVVIIDLLDRLLDHGIVLSGQATLSLAGVDLYYLDIRVLLTPIDKLLEHTEAA